MMRRMLIAIASCALLAVNGQPTGCKDDSQCTDGFYCQSDVHYCRKCLQCEDLLREPPSENMLCIRSVSECGPCLKGYVDDREGMGSGCIEPKSAEAVAWYLWVLGVLVIVGLLICAVGVVFYALRNTDSVRVVTSTQTSVEAPAVGKPVAPTAPQPPPYNCNAPYEPVRSASPDSNPPQHYGGGDYSYEPNSNADSMQPLVRSGKRVSRAGAAREAAGNQNARVYTNPSYVRNVPPPSYDSALSEDSEHEAPFVPLDEDTMPSDWVPAANTHDSRTIRGPFVPAEEEDTMPSGWTPDARYDSDNEETGATGASGGATALLPAPALRRPSRAESTSPPPNKIRCVEDSNNNRDDEPSSSGQPASPAPPSPSPAPAPAPAPALVIQVLNINALHQRNDLSL